jgi:hypothetical protein
MHIRRMQTLLVASILLARTIAGGASEGLPSSTEAPRASDLFRAKRMADEAAGRLQVRQPKRGGWVRGGGGWTPGTGTPKRKLPTRARVR